MSGARDHPHIAAELHVAAVRAGVAPRVAKARGLGARCAWRLLFVLCAGIGWTLLGSACALALSQRGHAFAFAFGGQGGGDGQFSGAVSVAVNEATGDVYVSDAGSNRIDQFQPVTSPQGAITGYSFKRAWGWGVVDGEKRYETCESGCKEGISGAKFFKAPGQIAVDNSSDPSDPSRGNVYVVANHIGETGGGYGGRVYEFGREGEPVSSTEQHGPEGAPAGRRLPAGQPPMALGTVEEEVKPGKWKRNEEIAEEGIAEELEVIEGVAVDSNGLVWLYGEDGAFRALTPHGALTGYEPALEASELGIERAPGRSGIAVRTLALGTKGSATQDRLFARYESGGEATGGKEPKGKGALCGAHRCLTAEINAFEVAEDQAEHIVEEGEDQVIAGALSGQPTTGVAVDPLNGDAYVDLSSAVAALDSTGTEIQRFGSPQAGFEGLKDAGGLAVDHAAGAAVGDVYAIEGASERIDVFAPAPAGAPAVDGFSTREVIPESAQLGAQIDPDGAPTTYTVQYSTSACTQSPSSCAAHFKCTAGPSSCGELPDPPGSAGEGFGDQDIPPVSLSGLAPSSTYHYRFLASNAHGTAVSETEGSFSTPPATTSGKGIADGRLWEMVSPPQKGGALIEALTKAGGVIQAASNGAAITYVTSAPIGQAEGNRSFELTQMLSSRGHDGWGSQDIMTPNEHGTGLEVGVGNEYRFFSADLSLALLEPFPGLGKMAEPPLSPPASEKEQTSGQENTVYLRADQPVAPQSETETGPYQEAKANGVKIGNPGYLALVTDANVLPGAQFGPQALPGAKLTHVLSFRDATPDLSGLIISSKAALTQESETPPNPENLYEWTGGKLRLINVLPQGETAASHPALGGESNQDVRNAVSRGGSRVFWTGKDAAGEDHLYVRDTAAAQTLQLDTVQPGASGEGKPDAVFQTASADGSRVFFTDTQRLTKHSGASAGKPDLYACEMPESQTSHELEECTEENHRLTDLTPEHETPTHEPESAGIQGVVLGASEDGSYVYFVANGVLSSQAEQAGATSGRCKLLRTEEAAPPGATCNLYSEHYDSAPGGEGWQPPRFIAALSNEDEPDWAAPTHSAVGPGELGQVSARVSPNGFYLEFMSQQSLTSFRGLRYDNRATARGAGNAPAVEVYEYAAPTVTQPAGGEAGRLVCASCEPSGARPVGVLDPPEQTAAGPEGLGLLVDRPRAWAGKWLAGSVPGWTRLAEEGETTSLHQSDYLSDSGRLFFNSPEALVPQDSNGRQDVYEYEPEGVPHGKHPCTTQSTTFSVRAEGCIGLISSGSADRESAFLDASETGGEGLHGEQLAEGGGDVFFLTAAPLSPQDTDASFDVYDSHECTTASPCILPPEQKPPPVCETTEACRSYTPSPSSPLGAPASAGPGAAGNLTPRHGVLPSKSSAKPKPKPLTRAQKLAKALKTCRAQHRHSRIKRAACEKQARKQYGPLKHKQAAKKASNRDARGGRRRVGGG